MSQVLSSELIIASLETIYMVSISTFFATLIGLPLGTLLFSSRVLNPHPLFYRMLNALINTTRSIPFIILLVLLIPFTRFLVGSSIGVHAAIVPLTLGASPFFARLVENAFHQLPQGLIDTAEALGASRGQMFRYMLLPEARPALMQAMTVTAITLVNYSAMAGTVGGGGLGDLAIRYGYQRFDLATMLYTVILLITFVQCIQWIGDKLSARAARKHNIKLEPIA
jgi:D-methionine transport system permease protein